MINRNHSADSNNFIFKTCMNNNSFIQRDFTKQFATQQLGSNHILSQKSSRPISFQDIQNSKFKLKKPKHIINYTHQSHDSSDRNKFVQKANFEKLQPVVRLQRNTDNPNLRSSRQSRNSRNSGQKIKILSIQKRDKAYSRQSNVSSESREKKGIGITKTLLKKISGMYSEKDFNRSCSNSTHKYKKQLAKDLHTTGLIGTTWDGQRTANQEYQLSQFDSTNNRISFDNFGFVSTYNVLNGLNQSTKIIPSRNSLGYTNNLNEGVQFSQQLKRVYMNNPSPYKNSFHQNYYPSNHHQSQNGNFFRQNSQSIYYQTQHVLPTVQKKHKINFIKNQERPLKVSAPISKQKMMFKHKSPQIKKSFTKPTSVSRETSDIKMGLSTNSNMKYGEQLTHMLYGNKDLTQTKFQQLSQQQRQKYVLKYKNKTLQELSLIQSTVSGYDNYYE